MSNLPKKEYQRKIRIKNKEYTINIKWLLQLKNSVLEEQTTSELEETLEKITRYLDIFAMGLNTINLRIKKAEVQYDKWYYEKYIDAEEKLTEVYQKEVQDGKRSLTKATPTQNSIKAKIIRDSKEEYSKHKKRLEKLKNKRSFMKQEFKILESRGNHIQSLLSMQRQILIKEN